MQFYAGALAQHRHHSYGRWADHYTIAWQPEVFVPSANWALQRPGPCWLYNRRKLCFLNIHYWNHSSGTNAQYQGIHIWIPTARKSCLLPSVSPCGRKYQELWQTRSWVKRQEGGWNKSSGLGASLGLVSAFKWVQTIVSIVLRSLSKKKGKTQAWKHWETGIVHVVMLFPPGLCCSGLGSGMCPSRRVLQPRAVLHGCLSSVCGGADLPRVCQAQRGVCQEATHWRPLWCQNWTGAPGNCVPENSCCMGFGCVSVSFSLCKYYPYEYGPSRSAEGWVMYRGFIFLPILNIN